MRGERATLVNRSWDVQRELRIKASIIAEQFEKLADREAFDTPGFIAGFMCRSYARYLTIGTADKALRILCLNPALLSRMACPSKASVC